MRNLETCDPRLQQLFQEVVKHFDCAVICGRRSREDQDAAYRTGRSKLQWPNSKHNVRHPDELSMAADVTPYPIVWDDLNRFRMFGGFVLGVASQMQIPIRWGGDWDRDTDLSDQHFNDLPHFELVG